MRLGCILALLMIVRSWYAWSEHQLRMIPDFDLYTQGGIGLYPSPIGRTLGAFGPDVFAAISSVSSGAVIVLVALLARKHKCNPALAATLAFTLPPSFYFSYAGIDSIGLALLLAFLVYRRTILVAAAALTHLSLMPFALLIVPRATWPVRVALTILGLTVTAAILTTPYSGVVYGIFHPEVFLAVLLALFALAIVAGPSLLLGANTGLFKFAAAVGVAECAMQHHLQVRYLLPAALIASSSANWKTAPAAAFFRQRLGGFTNSRPSPDNWTVQNER